MTRPILARAGAAVVLAAGLIVPTAAVGAAAPSPGGVGDLPAVTEDNLRNSVADIELERAVADIALEDTVADILLEDSVTDVATEKKSADKQTFTLSSDILFDFGKSALSPASTKRISQLVAKVPKSAAVAVGGHTDSIGTAAANQKLSTARAKAVAGAIRAARPDLKLTVKGYGETKPVKPNTSGGKDDPEGRAQNRRVEIQYAG